jgi:hypothetical protein
MHMPQIEVSTFDKKTDPEELEKLAQQLERLATYVRCRRNVEHARLYERPLGNDVKTQLADARDALPAVITW